MRHGINGERTGVNEDEAITRLQQKIIWFERPKSDRESYTKKIAEEMEFTILPPNLQLRPDELDRNEVRGVREG
jgi:hypothetical protein